MATRRKPTDAEIAAAFDDDEPTPTVIPGTGGALAPFDDDEPEESPAERVARQARELAADRDAVVKLYRVTPGSRALEWCEDYSPEDYERGGDSLIRAKWGPGTYQIRVYGNGISPRTGGVMRQCLARADITIAAPRETAAAVPQSGELAQVLTLLAKQNESILQAIAQRPQVDPHQQMMQTITMMGALREAMGGNVTPAAAPAPAPASQLAEIVAAIRELRGVAQEILPERGEEEPSLLGMLPRVLEVVKVGMTQQGQSMPALPPAQPLPPIVAPPLNVPPRPAAPVPRPAPVAVSSPDTETPMIPELQSLRAELDQLLAMAAAGASIEDGAERAYERLPDELFDILDKSWWFMQLALVAPDVKPHREWLTSVRDRVLQMLAEDAEADAADPAPIAPTPPAVDPSGATG